MYMKLVGILPAMLLALLLCGTPLKALELSDEEFANLPETGLLLPNGHYMTVEVLHDRAPFVELLYQRSPGGKEFDYVYADYLHQIRILDACPEGTKDNGRPCIEVIPDGGASYTQDYICDADFRVLAWNEHAYEEVADYDIVDFPCGDLDKLPEQGRLLPGRLLVRNFIKTALSEIYHPGLW